MSNPETPAWVVACAEAIRQKLGRGRRWASGTPYEIEFHALIHQHAQAREREIVEECLAIVATRTVLESTRYAITKAIRERFASLLSGGQA